MIRYSFRVVNRKRARQPFSVIVAGNFFSGYIGEMYAVAKGTAKRMNGKLVQLPDERIVICESCPDETTDFTAIDARAAETLNGVEV